MKIAVVSTMQEAPWGGSEEMWSAMAEVALEKNHQINTLTAYWPNTSHRLRRLESLGATVSFQMQPRRMPTRWNRYYRKFLTLGRVLLRKNRFLHFEHLLRWKPDVVCVNLGAIYEVLGYPGLMTYLETTSVPFVLVVQYADDFLVPQQPAQRSRISRIFARASKIVFVSQRNLEDSERHLVIRYPNAVVLRNPMNLTDFSPVPWPEPSETLSLASVARLRVRAKGQDVLLEALSQPSWNDRQWQLNLYGQGPDLSYLKALANMFGLNNKVYFHGQVDDIRKVWSTNHLLVMPSRGEGTPLSLAEAQICGRPAMVTNVGGNVEWVTEGTTGFIADGPYAAPVNAALERAWQQQDQWESMGIQAHQEASHKIDRNPGNSLLSQILEATTASENKAHNNKT